MSALPEATHPGGDCGGGGGGLEFEREGAREVVMPLYDYECKDCQKKFSIALTLAEHEKGNVKCPKCGSDRVEQQWAEFYATTSKKS
jgi:putative FmdB family regulatory protein